MLAKGAGSYLLPDQFPDRCCGLADGRVLVEVHVDGGENLEQEALALLEKKGVLAKVDLAARARHTDRVGRADRCDTEIAGYGLISIGVPSATSCQISSISALFTAMHPLVQFLM